jgi:Glucosidase II beta subunit-like
MFQDPEALGLNVRADQETMSFDPNSNCFLVARYYKSPDSFTCINNPSIQISASNVNDDVCDCPDGSDEVQWLIGIAGCMLIYQ